MKSLFKVTLLATTMAVALHAPITFAAEAAKPATTADSKAAFKNDDQKSAYALGASLGRYMENSLKEQEKLGIKLDKDQLIAGVQDAFADKSKLSDQEIEQTLQAFEARVKSSAQAKMEKDAAGCRAFNRNFIVGGEVNEHANHCHCQPEGRRWQNHHLCQSWNWFGAGWKESPADRRRPARQPDHQPGQSPA